MKKKSIRLLFILLIFPVILYSNDIYVSPNGDNSNSGKENEPFLDIEKAILKAFEFRKIGDTRPITIHLMPGEYHLNRLVHIPAELGDLTITGQDAKRVKIKGSMVLDLAWKKYDQHVYVAPVNENISFDQLVVNGEIQILARYPNYDENGGHFQGHAADAYSDARVKSWKNPVGIIVNAMHKAEWGDYHFIITGMDENGKPILTGGHQNNRHAELHPKYRMVENVFEELDSPGEWYLDKDTHLLYYWPVTDLDLGSAVFEGIVLKSLLEISGSRERPVRNIRISNITFEYTQRTFMEEYEPLLRSDWTIYRGGAVFITGAENCSIEDCEFVNLGGNVVFTSGYNRNVSISGNHIHDCGASGILFVGEPSAVRSPSFQYKEYVPLEEMDTQPGPKNDLYPKDCIAYNNLIHRTGRTEKQTAGVQIAMSMGITISHNSIYDVPRAGINIGDGTWGGHVLEYNDVFNTVLETGDHGSFNSWGRDRFWLPIRDKMDEITSNNPEMPYWDAVNTTVIHDNRFRCDHGWDIDLDDGSSNYHLYNNLCLNGGIKLREGFYRTVENNIMVNNGFHPHAWFANSGDVFRRNIVSAEHREYRMLGWGKEIDYNLFADEQTLANAREHDIDTHSTFGDPQFMDPQNYDFRVKDTSPALKLGFVNFAMDSFGVVKPAFKAIAKIPELPLMLSVIADGQADEQIVEWMGAKLKNITTQGERSAYGLSKAAGVLIAGVETNSIAGKTGLQSGDVIIIADDKDVENIKDLFSIYQGVSWKGKLNLVIFRNQSEVKVVMVIK